LWAPLLLLSRGFGFAKGAISPSKAGGSEGMASHQGSIWRFARYRTLALSKARLAAYTAQPYWPLMLAERLTAQLLAGPPARDPVAVAERLLAVQGQDPRGARLAIRARTTGLSAADVDRALTEDRSLLITWLNRGTLHLVRREDYPWLQALTSRRCAPATLDGSPRRASRRTPPSAASMSSPARLRRRARLRARSCGSASIWQGCAPRARRWCIC
jgi:hypothetical protein